MGIPKLALRERQFTPILQARRSWDRHTKKGAAIAHGPCAIAECFWRRLGPCKDCILVGMIDRHVSVESGETVLYSELLKT